jgi:hypothetical protein
MALDNRSNQTGVAYENSPKEINIKRGMPKSRQFGKEKMPQGSKPATRAYVKEQLAVHNEKYHHGQKPYHARHKEHR